MKKPISKGMFVLILLVNTPGACVVGMFLCAVLIMITTPIWFPVQFFIGDVVIHALSVFMGVVIWPILSLVCLTAMMDRDKSYYVG